VMGLSGMPPVRDRRRWMRWGLIPLVCLRAVDSPTAVSARAAEGFSVKEDGDAGAFGRWRAARERGAVHGSALLGRGMPGAVYAASSRVSRFT